MPSLSAIFGLAGLAFCAFVKLRDFICRSDTGRSKLLFHFHLPDKPIYVPGQSALTKDRLNHILVVLAFPFLHKVSVEYLLSAH